MKKRFIFLFFIPLIGFSQDHRPEIHCKHFCYGYPYGTPKTNDLIIRDIYALSNNDDTKFADWVAYRITMHEVDGTLTVDRKWKTDPWLEADETLEHKPDPYKNANNVLKVDRGHQVPLAAFKNSPHASETNYLSNITPQKSNLNQGPWVQLENKIRTFVKQGKTVYIMTGPLYEKHMPLLPGTNEFHRVPSGYWKIISYKDGNRLKTAAYIFNQNTPRNDKIQKHIVSIDEIEQRTGLDFFWLYKDESFIEKITTSSFSDTYFSN